jgi:hypothetical protein
VREYQDGLIEQLTSLSLRLAKIAEIQSGLLERGDLAGAELLSRTEQRLSRIQERGLKALGGVHARPEPPDPPARRLALVYDASTLVRCASKYFHSRCAMRGELSAINSQSGNQRPGWTSTASRDRGSLIPPSRSA